jgi:hypothetical protein
MPLWKRQRENATSDYVQRSGLAFPRFGVGLFISKGVCRRTWEGDGWGEVWYTYEIAGLQPAPSG